LYACSLKSVDKVQLYEVYNHYLHYSVFVSATRQEKQLCLQRCSFTIGMDLKLMLYKTITISGKRLLVIDQSFKRLYFDVLGIDNVSFTPLYKGVKTYRTSIHGEKSMSLDITLINTTILF
jgi:hypothetical protein